MNNTRPWTGLSGCCGNKRSWSHTLGVPPLGKRGPQQEEGGTLRWETWGDVP